MTPSESRKSTPAVPSSSKPSKPLKRAGHHGPRNLTTNEQKRALRAWWLDPKHGKRKHEDAHEWWQAQYGTELARSTMSDILGKKGAWLDSAELSIKQLSMKKNRKPDYPALEDALLEWQIRYDRHPDAGPITSDVLRLKATELWHKLPEYKDLPLPFADGKTWSNGWLSRFKERVALRERCRFGEATSAQVNAESEAIMEEVRSTAAYYDPDNVYNCDETGLFWKDRPDRTLSTFESAGRKKEKAQIIAEREVIEEDSDEEDSDGMVEKPIISNEQALDAIRTLITYQEQQEIEDYDLKRLLERKERDIILKIGQRRRQESLLNYFSMVN